MLFALDLDSSTPLYQQIRDQVVDGLATGQLWEGEPLPTIRQFASDFGINLHTVRKAYEILEREGFVRVQRQRGVVVSRTGRRDAGAPGWEARLRTLLAEEYAHGQTRDEILERCRRVLSAFNGTGTERERTTEV
jgi:GntR family transcriptional regulator